MIKKHIIVLIMAGVLATSAPVHSYSILAKINMHNLAKQSEALTYYLALPLANLFSQPAEIRDCINQLWKLTATNISDSTDTINALLEQLDTYYQNQKKH